jgi:hypothetical protein
VQRRRTVSTDLHVSKTSSRWGSPRGEGRSPIERNLLKKKNSISFEQVPVLIAARVARFAQLRRARPRSATGSPYSRLKSCFLAIPGKKEPHIRILAAFSGSGGGKLSGKNSLDLMAFGRL